MYTSLILDLCIVSKPMLLLHLFIFIFSNGDSWVCKIESLIHGFQGLPFIWRIFYFNRYDKHSSFTMDYREPTPIFSPSFIICCYITDVTILPMKLQNKICERITKNAWILSFKNNFAHTLITLDS